MPSWFADGADGQRGALERTGPPAVEEPVLRNRCQMVSRCVCGSYFKIFWEKVSEGLRSLFLWHARFATACVHAACIRTSVTRVCREARQFLVPAISKVALNKKVV